MSHLRPSFLHSLARKIQTHTNHVHNSHTTMDPNLTHRQHMKYDEAYLSPYPPIQLTKNTREPDYTQPQHMINDDHYVSPYASSQIQTPTPIQNEASMQSAWSGVFPTPDSATYTYPIPSPYDPSNYSVYPKQTPYDGMQPHHSAFGPPRQPADIGRQQLQDQGQTQNSSWQPWYMLGQQKEVGFAKLAFEDLHLAQLQRMCYENDIIWSK